MENKISVKTSHIGDEDETDIPFENLQGDKSSQIVANQITLGISILIYVVAIAVFIAYVKGADVELFAWLFWFFIASIILYKYFSTRNILWKIRLINDQYITMHKNVPKVTEVDEFLNELMNTRNNYLKETYLELNNRLSYEGQLNNLKWLKAMNVIDKDEYIFKRDELDHLFSPAKRIIGFEK